MIEKLASKKVAIYFFPILLAAILATTPSFLSPYVISVIFFLLVHLTLGQSYDLRLSILPGIFGSHITVVPDARWIQLL